VLKEGPHLRWMALPAIKLPVCSRAALHDELQRGAEPAPPLAAAPVRLPFAQRGEAEPEARPPPASILLPVSSRGGRAGDGDSAGKGPASARRGQVEKMREEVRAVRDRTMTPREQASEALRSVYASLGLREGCAELGKASLHWEEECPPSQQLPLPRRKERTLSMGSSSEPLSSSSRALAIHKRRSTSRGHNASRFVREHGTERSVHDIYEFGRALGEGAWGTTWEAWPRPLKGMTDSLRTQGTRAIKQLPKHRFSEEERKVFLQEAHCLKELDHPHICKLHEVFEDAKALYLVMDLCEGGELFDRIVEDQLTGEVGMAEIVRQIASALRYCHETHGVVHRDIKPENILFFSRHQDAPVKLIDFGLARHFKGVVSPGGQAGTAAYEAPEVLAGKAYDEKCDLWSLGTLLYVMLCGYMPFQSVDHAIEGEYSFDTDDWDAVSDAAKDLISQLLVVDPEMRMSAAEALEHPWLQTAPETSSVQPRVLARLKNFQQISAFRKILLVVLARQLSANDLPDMYEAFKALDRDGDGMVSHKELRNILSTKMGTDELEQVLDAMDVDGSGQMEYSEFLATAFDRKLLFRDDLILQVFRALGRDESGTVGIQELHALLDDVQTSRSPSSRGVSEALREEARELLDQHDRDGNGKLDFHEFARLLTRETCADYVRRASRSCGRGSPLAVPQEHEHEGHELVEGPAGTQLVEPWRS